MGNSAHLKDRLWLHRSFFGAMVTPGSGAGKPWCGTAAARGWSSKAETTGISTTCGRWSGEPRWRRRAQGG